MVREWPWKKEKLTDIWSWPHISWLTLINFWVEENQSSTQRRVKLVLRATHIVYMSLTVFSMYIAAGIKLSDFGVIKNLIVVCPAATATMSAFKIIEVARNKKNFRKAMDLLNELSEEINLPEDVEFLKKGLFRVWFVYILNMMECCAITGHWCLRPVLIAVLYQEQTAILETWPTPLDNWTQFFFTYFAQFSAAFPLAIGFNILDNIYLCTCQYVLSHIGLIRKNLEDLRLNGQQIETVTLRNIVKRHIKILRVCKELKSASDAALTFQIVATILIFCTGVFAVTANDQLSVNMLMNLIEILFLTSFRLFLFAWFSTEVSLKCRNVGIAAYRSDWLNGSEPQKKQLMIIVSKTMQPVLFGGLIQMDFDTFLMVFKTAFSYYNFLLAAFQGESQM